MSLSTFLTEYSQHHPPRETPTIGYAPTEQDLPIKQLLKTYNYQRIERTTTKGFQLSWHKDHYLLRKFNGEYQFIPYDKDPPLSYSLIWYKQVDCQGGAFEFYPDVRISPYTGMYILFDNTHIHRVLPQHNGTRTIVLYKFY